MLTKLQESVRQIHSDLTTWKTRLSINYLYTAFTKASSKIILIHTRHSCRHKLRSPLNYSCKKELWVTDAFINIWCVHILPLGIVLQFRYKPYRCVITITCRSFCSSNSSYCQPISLTLQNVVTTTLCMYTAYQWTEERQYHSSAYQIVHKIYDNFMTKI